MKDNNNTINTIFRKLLLKYIKINVEEELISKANNIYNKGGWICVGVWLLAIFSNFLQTRFERVVSSLNNDAEFDIDEIRCNLNKR